MVVDLRYAIHFGMKLWGKQETTTPVLPDPIQAALVSWLEEESACEPVTPFDVLFASQIDFADVERFFAYLICLSVRLSVYLSVYLLPIYLPICLPTYLPICLSVYLPTYPSIHPSVHLSIYPSIHLSICPSVHLSIYPSIYLSIDRSID